MRESIGGAWLYGLVLSFTLFFVAFLIITINYTRAFRVKNEVVDFIERNEGVTTGGGIGLSGTIPLINNYLIQSGYNVRGNCPTDDNWFGVTDMTRAGAIEPVNGNTTYFYCFRRDAVNDRVFYDIRVFFSFDLPILGTWMNLPVHGRTIEIGRPADCGELWARWNEVPRCRR